jgi:hypothetical protein
MGLNFVRFLSGGLAILFISELFLRSLPVSTASRASRQATGVIRTYAPHHTYVIAADWNLSHPQTIQTNNFGFATSTPFVRNEAAIALIGDSLVEGSALPEDDRVASRLQARMGSRTVYMMAMAGTSLADYTARIEWGHRVLAIKTFVVVVNRTDIAQSVCAGGGTFDRCIHPTTLQPVEGVAEPRNKLRELAAQSALAQYFFGHLRFSAAGFIAAAVPKLNHEKTPLLDKNPTSPALTSAQTAVIEHFLSRLKTLSDTRVILVEDCERPGRYAGAPVARLADMQKLIEEAQKQKITVITSCDAFDDAFSKSAQRTEISKKDTHWNARGHEIIADTVAKSLGSPR